MIDKIDIDKCTGCTACVNACPSNCLKMIYNKEGFLYPQMVNADLCIKCNKCLGVCQVLDDKISIHKGSDKLFVCQNKSDELREKSTSGGVYSLLANKITENGGIVFGAILNEKLVCVHENSEEVNYEEFCGSKYVQSSLKDSYKKVKEYLQFGTTVCFSGTPCQVYGLKKYLGKEYENLLLVDLLCHGVPSPGVFQKYKNFLIKKYKKNAILKFNFRSKKRGYKYSALSVEFEDKTNYLSGLECDQYLRLFFSNIILRKSCYSCKFRSEKRVGDITLFDCWHIGEYQKDMNDDRGTTSVMINTEKGNMFFNELTKELKYTKVDAEKCLKLDGDMTYRVISEPENRSGFFQDYANLDFDILLNKYVPITWKMQLKKSIKNLILLKKKLNENEIKH